MNILPGLRELKCAAMHRRFASHYSNAGNYNAAYIHKAKSEGFVFLSRKERERAEALSDLLALGTASETFERVAS